eukprot:JP440551.1.p1 GENE.JP440551.1~~JP440551.1.p1  ORF type:complete len:87 (+),score=7.75 JP440551.1:1-261(+)
MGDALKPVTAELPMLARFKPSLRLEIPTENVEEPCVIVPVNNYFLVPGFGMKSQPGPTLQLSSQLSLNFSLTSPVDDEDASIFDSE